MSYHSLSTKPLNKSMSALLKRASHVGLGLGAFTPVLALANPTGAAVMTGQASITSPAANGLVIHQSSQSAIINWQQFNIGAGQYVQFLQPSTSSVVLNRVVGGSPTSIFGSLTANGQVFIVNTNGVFFGHGATIDAQGFLASSLDISDNDFLSKHYVFDEAGAGNGKVVNQGTITAHRGGYVVLAGDYSENDGLISAQSGHVILASGAKSTLTLSGNSLVRYVVNGATLSALAGVDNAGKLAADGGTVIMTADVANALKATVVNNTGLVEARNITKSGSSIILSAVGGNIVNAGTLDADALVGGNAGGDIVLKGDDLTDLTNTSKISALGMGAAGGNLELSGKVLNVRGTAALGKGGRLLLDPDSIELIETTGATSAGTGGSAGVGKGTGAGGGLTKIGTGFILHQLGAGASVDISAAALISASAAVKAAGITANTTTAGAGVAASVLKFKVGSAGMIELKGVDITTAGALDAFMKSGSFGHLTAKTIDLDATGSIELPHAVLTKGVITTDTAKATGGNLSIAGTVKASGTGSLALAAVGGNLHVASVVNEKGNVLLTDSGGTLHAASVAASFAGNVTITDNSGKMQLHRVSAPNGNVTISAKGQTLSFTGAEAGVQANGNIAVTAATITASSAGGPQLDFDAFTGNVTVAGQISLPSEAEGHKHDLFISAAGTIDLDHGIVDKGGSVHIQGQHLAYTGGGKNFSLSAGNGDLTLDASIGSAAKLVNYNVNLTDKGYGLQVEKSIFTGNTAGGLGANISAIETGRHSGASSHSLVGVLVGNPQKGAVTLSANGSITLTGHDVGVGQVLHSHTHSTMGAVTLKAGKNVALTATGVSASYGGDIGVDAGHASYGAQANASVLISAGANLTMMAEQISVGGGIAQAHLPNGHASSSANANVTLLAGNTVSLTGGSSAHGRVQIDGGSAVAGGSAGSKQIHKSTANATVTVSGTKGVALTAERVSVSGGYGAASASAGESGAAMTATANASVLLQAKSGNIALTGNAASGQILVQGGNRGGSGNQARADGTKAIASATAHGDVSLLAGGAINLAADVINVIGGSDVARGAKADALVGSANLTATGIVNMQAGAGGISLVAKNAVNVRGGSDAAAGFQHSFTSSTGTTNSVTGTIRTVHHYDTQVAHASANAAAGAKATLSGNAGVTFTTPGVVTVHQTLASNGYAEIAGGGGAAKGAEVNAFGAKANATVNGVSSVVINAGSLSLTGHNMGLNGGSEIAGGESSFGTSFTQHRNSANVVTGTSNSHPFNHAPQNHAAGSGATAKLAGDGSVTLHGGAVTLTANGNNLNISGGYGALSANQLTGSSYGGKPGTLTAIGNAGVNITASSLLLQATGNVKVAAGRAAAANATALGSHGAVIATGGADVNLTVSGNANILASYGNIVIQGGSGAAARGHAFAVGKGKATLTGSDQVNLVAGAVNATANNGKLFVTGGYLQSAGQFSGGGQGAAQLAGAQARSSGSAAVNGNASVNIQATTGGISLNAGQLLSVRGGGRAAAGLARSYSISSGTHTTNSGNTLKTVHHHEPQVSNASAYATSAAKATVSGNAGVTLTAKGAVTMVAHASGGAAINGGSSDAASARVFAVGGTKAAATVSGVGSVVVKGASVSVTAGNVGVDGGGDVARGASSSRSSTYTHVQKAAGGSSHTNVHSSGYGFRQDQAGGGAAGKLAGDASVTLQGATVSLIAKSGDVGVSGGVETLAGGHFIANSSGGKAGTLTATGKANVNINAGNLLLQAVGNVDVIGGNGAGYQTRITATKGTVNASGSADVNLTATGTATFLASYGNVVVRGGEGGADAASVQAYGGKATLTTNGAVNIVAGAVNVTATIGNVSVSGGYGVAQATRAEAGIGGSGMVNAVGGVNIRATTGGITLTAKNSLNVRGGGAAAAGASSRFTSSGAKSFSSPNAWTQHVHAHFPQINYTEAFASGTVAAKSQATISANNGVTLTAKGTVALSATSVGSHGGGNVDAHGGGSAGGHAFATAVGGATANVNGVGTLVVKGATIALTGHNVSVHGGSGAAAAENSVGSSYTLHHKSSGGTSHTGVNHYNFTARPTQAFAGATAKLSGDGSVTLQGGTIGLTANGGNLDISGGYGAGIHAQVMASYGGLASVTAHTGVNITAATAFTALAKGNTATLNVQGGGGSGGSRASVLGLGSKSKALLNGNGQVTITAPVVTLIAGKTLTLQGGNGAGSNHTKVTGAFGGSANLTAAGGVNVTVGSKFTASLSGSSSNGARLTVSAGVGAGADGGRLSASFGGKANFNVNEDVDITAVGTGGLVTLSTGKRKGAVLALNSGKDTGAPSSSSNFHTNFTKVVGNESGAATMDLSADLNLTAAKGTVSLTAGAGNLDINEVSLISRPRNAQGVQVDAAHGTANFTASDNVNITGSAVNLHAGTYTVGPSVHGGEIDVQTGASRLADRAEIAASSGGVANFTANQELNVVATGTLTVAAAGNFRVGDTFDGFVGCCSSLVAQEAGASAHGSGAKATFNVNGSTLLQGNAAVTITAGKFITMSGVSGAQGAHADAFANGQAVVNLTEQVNIKTNGAFTAHAGSSIRLRGESGGGRGVALASSAGHATLTQDGTLNVSANTVVLSAGHEVLVGGGFSGSGSIHPMSDGGARASYAGVATFTNNRGANITATGGITMALTGSASGGFIDLDAGDAGGLGYAVAGSHGHLGKAIVTETSNVNLTAGGGITLTTGKHKDASISVAGGRIGRDRLANSGSSSATISTAKAQAGAGASASLNLSANVNVNAKGALAVTTGVGGAVYIYNANGNLTAAQVMGNGGKATLNGQAGINLNAASVTLTAGRQISVTAASGVFGSATINRSTISGGSSTLHARPLVGAQNGGIANMNLQTGVKITTAGAFTATAGSDLSFLTNGLSHGAHVASNALVLASHSGAKAALVATNSIQVNAGAITLTDTKGGLDIVAGSSAAHGAQAIGLRGKAALSVDQSITMNAAGNFTANAGGGSMFVQGGRGAGSSGVASAAGRGMAALSVNSGVTLKAGGTLTLSAKGDLAVSGGKLAAASVGAQAASASVNVNAGVNLAAGKSASLTAGGNLSLVGGGSAFLLGDEFLGSSAHAHITAGNIKGTLVTGVNLTAHSSAALKAGGNLTVAAGAGAIVAVGAFRVHTSSGSGLDGHSWAGGQANLNANVGAAVTAGKNVTLTAGTAGAGSLAVTGLGKSPGTSHGFFNIVSVRGGSDRATANVAMTGNALITAGGTITVAAAGNASIAGGDINDVRADHTVGHVTLTGSADAGLHAGVDVMLNNITGSLTLAGANAGPSEQGILVDAHGNSGTAIVTGHADAAISAGRDIVTVKSLGGGLNLLGGDLVDAVAIGSATNQTANGTANASLKAGRNITINAAGNLNVLGGQFDQASASGAGVGSGPSFVPATGTRTATMQAEGNILATGAVTLKFTGNGVLAGGDSVAAIVNFGGASAAAGTATADAGANIKGTTVSLTVGGNLLARGGSGAKGEVIAEGGGITGNASASVGVNVVATKGNAAVTVGGSASFLGGSGVGGKVINLGASNVANATAHADVDLSATGTLTVTLTGTGNLFVAGTPDAEQFGTVIGGAPANRLAPSSIAASNGKTNLTASGAVQFTAGGAITVTQHGGNLTIMGGSNAASFASANAVGKNEITNVTVNSNVLIKAGGALTFTGADNVMLSGGRLPSGSASPGLYIVSHGLHAMVNEKLNSTVILTGTKVSVGHTGTQNTHSSGHFISGPITQLGSVSIASVAVVHAAGLLPATHGVLVQDAGLQVAPLATQASFGGVQGFSGTKLQVKAVPQAVLMPSPTASNVSSETMPLSTLQTTSIVPSLMTLLGADAGSELGASLPIIGPTLFTPAIDTGGYSKSFSGTCTALVVKGGDTRCSTGGK